jgi:hypothetical protein
MGRYSGTSSQRESSVKQARGPHEIWRGIGCLMILVIPAMSIAAGSETVKYMIKNHSNMVPYQLRGFLQLPDVFYKSSGLLTIFYPITKIQNFYGIAVVSLIYMLLISGLISVIYAAVYGMVGPSRYGPTDAPPPKIKITKKSR